MKKALIFLLSLILLVPVFSEAKSKHYKKKYYAYRKYKKHRKRLWIRRYPRRANTLTDAHRVKLEEMIKEMF